KKTTGRLGAGVSFSLISFWTALGFLILSGFSGGLGSVRSASWQANTVMVVSAVFAIGLAHPLYYYSLRVLGVTVCQVILLTTPIFTILASGVFFGEKLTLVQAVFGALLLGGGAVAVLAREPQADLPAVKDS
ncbi:MAG: DMT family transporter, partial [Verrucomicrobiae bacterium]|nr:DMT family transporter [Verrucomicrobiae bacterium]